MGLNRMFLHCFSLDLPPISDEAREDNDSVGNEIHCTNNNCDGTKDRIKCIAPLPSKLSDVLHREFMLPIWEESIVGTRFVSGRKELRLSSNQFTSRIENKRHLCEMLDRIILGAKRLANDTQDENLL